MTDQSIRSFIAIELPEEVKSGILELRNEFNKAGCTSIKWVAPQSIHLTLKFLGDVQLKKIDEIKKALEKATQGIAPFQLNTGELGAFPNLRKPRIFWLGLTGDLKLLLTLQQGVDKALIALGFPKEDRPFSPHITIARVRESATHEERTKFGEQIGKVPFTNKYDINVDSINLMKSQLLPTGAVYSCLTHFTLET